MIKRGAVHAKRCSFEYGAIMNRDEFLRTVRADKIFPEMFSLDVDRDEKYVALNRGDGWVVYYSERGLESSAHHFASESEALEYLLTLLRSRAQN